MILYHGTNMDFDGIELSKSSPYKDFGKGFYLADIRNQAEQLAEKKAKLFKGTPIVQMTKELQFRELNNQYFFGTEKAIKLLKRI